MLDTTANAGAVLVFDYDQLPSDTSRQIAAAATRVRSALKATKSAMLNVGGELLDVKERLPHGQFGAWLLAEFDMDERTARNYMRVAETFAEKTETVSVLPPVALYALSSKSTPEHVREVVQARLVAGERVTTQEVKGLVQAARLAGKVEARRSTLSPAKRKRLDREEAKRRLEWDAQQAEHEQRHDVARQLAQDLIAALPAQTLSGLTDRLSAADPYTLGKALAAEAGAAEHQSLHKGSGA